ncbi:MAG: radical SAM protein [Deltaproteobacteria bacterium]|nr:MAG: radical SAM protein [Deltaproteobacteria bacterium]
MGFLGESVLNPDFFKISAYLKETTGAQLNVSTNGQMLNDSRQNKMLDMGFDSISYSMHGITENSYRILHGQGFDRALNNLIGLHHKKKERNLANPKVTIQYALNKVNINETVKMLELAHKLGVHGVNIYHYRDYGFSGISLYDSIEAANKEIDRIYEYARKNNLRYLLPAQKPYFMPVTGQRNSVEQDIAADSNTPCHLPWQYLVMRASFATSDSYYVGFCNVLNLFFFNYAEYLAHKPFLFMKDIWHSEPAVYLRKTVNRTPNRKRNPFCSYCKSPLRQFLKNTNDKKNREIKLERMDAFIYSFLKECPEYKDVIGLKLLKTEPLELEFV